LELVQKLNVLLVELVDDLALFLLLLFQAAQCVTKGITGSPLLACGGVVGGGFMFVLGLLGGVCLRDNLECITDDLLVLEFDTDTEEAVF